MFNFLFCGFFPRPLWPIRQSFSVGGERIEVRVPMVLPLRESQRQRERNNE